MSYIHQVLEYIAKEDHSQAKAFLENFLNKDCLQQESLTLEAKRFHNFETIMLICYPNPPRSKKEFVLEAFGCKSRRENSQEKSLLGYWVRKIK